MKPYPGGRRGGLHVLPLGTLCVVAALVPLAVGSVHQILWGRCYAHCLENHLATESPEDTDQSGTAFRSAIQTCQRHNVCKWCLYVCERPEDQYTDSENCLHDCRNTRTNSRSASRQACVHACSFVSLTGASKTGNCPAPDTLVGFESACVESCHGDADCPNARKCCHNGCGKVCTDPHDPEALPEVPSNITFRLLGNGGVLVRWELMPTDDLRPLGPVVYILRWWCPYISGVVTELTDQTKMRLKGYPTGIYPGAKCHFMVASVNTHGSRGFSKVAPYIKKFMPPSPPEHLEEARSIVKDGNVDVKIQWQPPLYTDGLLIHKYEVSWSDSLPPASPNYMRLHMNKRDVPPDQMSFTLHSLSPGTIYFVQVRAVVEWKGRRKKGRPASTYIEVYSPPQQAPNGGQGRFSGDRETESDIESLTVSQAFFHDNILKASLTWKLKSGKRARKYLIYWKPQTCATHVQHRKRQDRPETSATSHDEQFSLYNLQPECEYAVSVQPVSHTGRKGPPVVTSFQTLPCRLIAARDGQQPRCEVLERPDKVKGLHTETVACRTVVRWTPILAGSEVVSYLVRWGQSDDAYFSFSTVIFTSDPEELQIPANETAVNLGYLEPGRHYTVQVMGQSSAGPGQPTVQHFTVPLTTTACSQEQSSTATAPVKTVNTVTSSVETVTPTVTNSTSPKGYHNTHHMNITLRNSSISSGQTFGGFDTGDNHRQNVSSTDNSNDGVTDLAKDKNSSDAYNTTLSFEASSTPVPRTHITQGGAGGPVSSSGDHLHTSLLCLVSYLVIAMTFAAKALCT